MFNVSMNFGDMILRISGLLGAFDREGHGMAGHSQWANRKHRKARQDAKKGKIYSMMAKKIAVAAREGGGDPETNSALRMAIDEAKALGVPNDNIDRAIKRGTGELEGAQYEEMTYEGYGPGGTAILLEILTDNRNRTAAEIRHLFSKHGGNLGEAGCVAWMFQRKGQVIVESDGLTEEDLFLSAAEAGAEDLIELEDGFAVITPPSELEQVRSGLIEEGYEIKHAKFIFTTDNQIEVTDKEAERLLKFLDALEDHDDVQEIHANFEVREEDLARFVG